ncbi:MAG: hypothetical protein SVM86_03815 [Candidatus Cloacimonadota bacterium]|nr:hypothetical protein [Candidatus Cloacimonadota bacterium]
MPLVYLRGKKSVEGTSVQFLLGVTEDSFHRAVGEDDGKALIDPYDRLIDRFGQDAVVLFQPLQLEECAGIEGNVPENADDVGLPAPPVSTEETLEGAQLSVSVVSPKDEDPVPYQSGLPGYVACSFLHLASYQEVVVGVHQLQKVVLLEFVFTEAEQIDKYPVVPGDGPVGGETHHGVVGLVQLGLELLLLVASGQEYIAIFSEKREEAPFYQGEFLFPRRGFFCLCRHTRLFRLFRHTRPSRRGVLLDSVRHFYHMCFSRFQSGGFMLGHTFSEP